MTTDSHRRRRPVFSLRATSALCLSAVIALLNACALPPAAPRADRDSPALENAAPVAAAPAATAPTLPVAELDPPTAPVPIDPLRPEVHLDLDDRAAQVDLWERVRRGFSMPELDNDQVHKAEQWYASRPDYVARMTERGSRYLFYIVEELDRRGMPTELALLPFIESAFNPQAMSTAKASGMWQFVPATGRDYALKQNIFRDDRRDVLASTRAALDHLQRLYGLFGDWQLALAAYNWGEGNVQRAINRNQMLGLPTDYASLKMPSETQYYVPKLQAVKNIISQPADFGLTLPVLLNHPYFLSVPIERDMDVAVAVKLAGIPLDEFQTLNPQMNKPVILAAGTPQVLLPYDNANQFVRSLPLHRGPLASWTAWVVPKTVQPSVAARQVGMSEAELREINHIPPHMLVKAGSTLLVPRTEHRMDDVSSTVADNATMSLAPDLPPLRKLSLKAGRKDSVATIAKRYHVSAAQVAQWNVVPANASFKAGQSVVVFVGGKAAPRRTRTARGSTASTVAKRQSGKVSDAPKQAKASIGKSTPSTHKTAARHVSKPASRQAAAQAPVREAHN